MRLVSGVQLGPYEGRPIGLVEVWEREGPPDLCRRTGAGTYLCQ